ncbi:TPA_asm: hypothetical protein G2718_04745 [Salmonella enterica subsp. enterica serovar Enteritidis]|nr:hypothetical protein [Salmonella enterica subsp. enterica serovar Enteritidis]
MSAILTKAFEKWVAECTTDNLPARPDAIIFALMEREPSREDDTIPQEKITYTVSELTYGQLNPNSIVCSAVVVDDVEFSYDWICLVHQPSRTLCGVIKTPVRQKFAGESLIRNFVITYTGLAQTSGITTPPQSWQVDITPELRNMLKSGNHLSEIAAAGETAQQESRDNLGLKGAATKDVQTDIYDRTPERVAMPGAFGYGAFFRTIKMFSADKGPSEFLPWVRSNPPGQYAVSQYGGNGYKPILEGVVFDGIVEIKIPGTVVSNESHHIKDKLVIFYGSNGEVYHNRLIVNSISGDRFRGWRNWLLGADGIANTLSSLRGSGYGYPDIGGVVLAAYCGTSDTDSSRKFYRGVRVPGSRLAVISVTAACNTGGPYASTPQVIVASPGLCPMAGTFTALSGLPGNSGGTTTAMIGLFVRTA